MPNEKQFDFATIAVIVVSILLILGGFYLLNQSFTKKQDPSKVSISNISSNSYSSLSSSQSIAISSSTNLSSSSAKPTSSESSSSISSNSSNSDSSPSSISSKISTLSESEATVKVIDSSNGSNYIIEVIDTGFKDGKFWKVGKQFKINSTILLKQDKEYRLSGISEANNSTTIGLIQEKK
jgi:hypothetical protein